MDNYSGVIIEESLADKGVLEKVRITNTIVKDVTDRYKTPWLKHWTLHTVEIPEDQAAALAKEISRSLDKEHPWYADYKNTDYHYIIFLNKIFKIARNNQKQYNQAKEYGLALGIPEYQVDFRISL